MLSPQGGEYGTNGLGEFSEERSVGSENPGLNVRKRSVAMRAHCGKPRFSELLQVVRLSREGSPVKEVFRRLNARRRSWNPKVPVRFSGERRVRISEEKRGWASEEALGFRRGPVSVQEHSVNVRRHS